AKNFSAIGVGRTQNRPPGSAMNASTSSGFSIRCQPRTRARKYHTKLGSPYCTEANSISGCSHPALFSAKVDDGKYWAAQEKPTNANTTPATHINVAVSFHAFDVTRPAIHNANNGNAGSV